MSLDVYLNAPKAMPGDPAGPRIFVRRNGSTEEITRAEWDELHPGREPVVFISDEVGDSCQVFSANITHNLGEMAKAAGLYEALWRPEEIGIEYARDLIAPLAVGLETLVDDPEQFRALNPPNGWGDYEGQVRFVVGYLSACVQDPDATVSVWR